MPNCRPSTVRSRENFARDSNGSYWPTTALCQWQLSTPSRRRPLPEPDIQWGGKADIQAIKGHPAEVYPKETFAFSESVCDL